ncbi:serine protease [Streptomyces sp. NPDC094034]|uniref:serine protease n=1 Tax=Streptomyces sp. NPDC094034 TaxID=3155309 RepID=UPI0033247B3A
MVETASTPDPLAAAVLRVRYPDGTAVGAGFLVTGELAVTCAHVVASALGLDDDERPAAGATVEVDLPLGPVTGPVDGPAAVAAAVEYWPEDGPSGARDIAVLRLRSTLAGSAPLRMAEADDVWGHPVRTFGFPARHADGVWHAGVLRARQGAGWLQVERAAGSNHAISRGFSGAPVWDERLGAAVGMVVAADPQQPSAFLIPTGELLLAVPSLREAVLPPSPFRGLSAFQESDSEVFHGRDEESDEVAALVTEHPVVTVFGPSGCGKSSLVRAGVVPRLRKAGHAVVIVRPGGPSGLLGGLAMELTRLTRPELTGSAQREESRVVEAELSVHGWGEILAQLTGAGGGPDTDTGTGTGMSTGTATDTDTGGGARTSRGARTRRARGVRGLVVVVDQLEELLDHGTGARSAAEAVAALFPEHPPSGLRVLSTLRADFLEAVSARPGLERALRGTSLLLPAMSAEQVRQAVVLPVEAIASVGYADGLEQRILADCGDAQGVLPLLEFTLDQLWERQRGGLLTHGAYEELGGVSGALAERAETVWLRAVRETGGQDRAEGAEGAGEATARRLFTRLVRLPLGGPAATRRVVPRAELGEPEWAVARALARERLVVIGLDDEKRETVELAHETLIRAWHRLGVWVERDRDFLAWREGIRHDRERWEAADRAPDLLPAASALDVARRWERERGEDLSEADADFLRRGRDRERTRTRRRRGLFMGIGTVLALAAVLGSLFVYQTGVTEERAAEADSRSMAAASTDLRATDPALSALLAISAYRRSPTESARDALLQSYLTYGRASRLMSGTLGRVRQVAASEDGRVVLATTALGRATLFVRDDDGRIRRAHLPAKAEADHPVVARDGKSAGYVASNGKLLWYQVRAETDTLVANGRTISPAPIASTRGSAFRQAAVSSDGSRVVAVVSDDLVVWDLAKGSVVRRITPPEGQDFLAVWFGADRDTVLAYTGDFMAGRDYTLRAYEGSRPPRTVVSGVNGAEVSGDGSAVAFCRGTDVSAKALYQVVRVADGKESGRFASDGPCVERMAIDRTGRHIAVGDLVGDVMWLADTKQRKLISEIGARAGIAATDAALGRRQPYGRLVWEDGRFSLLGYGPTGVTVTGMSADVQEFLPADRGAVGAVLTPDGATAISKWRAEELIRTHSVAGAGARSGADAGSVAGGFTTAASVERPAPVARGSLKVSTDGSLVADPTDSDIVIREVPSLREVSVLSPAEIDDPSLYEFTDDRHLLTTTDTTVERWDARSGRRTHRTDLRDLDLDGSSGSPVTWPYPKEAHVAVLGDTFLHVVDLRTGREVKELRVEIGPDATGLRIDATGRYLAVFRRGGDWELWRLDPARRELGPVSGAGGSGGGGAFTGEFIDGEGRFLVADAGKVRIYEPGRRSAEESFDFGTAMNATPGTFPAVSADGSTLLYDDEGQTIPVRLDPEEWAARLCAVTGQRTLTSAERDAIPAEVPPGAVCGD